MNSDSCGPGVAAVSLFTAAHLIPDARNRVFFCLAQKLSQEFVFRTASTVSPRPPPLACVISVPFQPPLSLLLPAVAQQSRESKPGERALAKHARAGTAERSGSVAKKIQPSGQPRTDARRSVRSEGRSRSSSDRFTRGRPFQHVSPPSMKSFQVKM